MDRVRLKKLIHQWEVSASLGSTPHAIKQNIVKEYAQKFGTTVFVETGTCLGEMIYAVKRAFNKIYSIELDEELYLGAKELFSKYNHINVIHGDSKSVLKDILDTINEPAMFWLDAHYSGGITSKGENETPVMEELNIIFNEFKNKYVILIDDARCFNGKNDYPTVDEVKNLMLKKHLDWVFTVQNDIIRMHPQRTETLSSRFSL